MLGLFRVYQAGYIEGKYKVAETAAEIAAREAAVRAEKERIAAEKAAAEQAERDRIAAEQDLFPSLCDKVAGVADDNGCLEPVAFIGKDRPVKR